MTLVNGSVGAKFVIKEIKENELNAKLLSLGLCSGDEFFIENIANGNVLIKTLETKIVLSENLAEKVHIEALEMPKEVLK